MKSVEFCYWLQGLFELGNPQSLSAEQTELVKRHLAMVFKHEIDPGYGANQQSALNAIHAGKPGSLPVSQDHVHPNDAVFRC